MSGETKLRPWEWRKASGGWWLNTETPGHRIFHLYDVNDNSACEPPMGLIESCEVPNEGSELCPACISFAAANPAGRDRRPPPSIERL